MRRFIKASCNLLFLVAFSGFAQDIAIDSTGATQLEEVVVTGQIEPQSLKKSVYNVRVITREDILRQAGNNLSDVLNQYINISVRADGTSGRSTISMFGLDSQYFKILVDNIPLVSDSGLGNSIDLTQINLDDIERIEIIEGSMGVTHGANAVSGILNIITKKSSSQKWQVTAAVQEETAGKEYAWFDKGRHIQSIKISHQISDSWFVSAGANRTDFAGFYGEKQGRDYTVNDGLRGYSSWLPKQQLATNALLSYSKGAFRVFYKFDYYNEEITFYNSIVTPTIDFTEYYGRDRRYYTNRFFHHLNSYGHLFGKLVYNVSASYQTQKREQENYNYYIFSGTEGYNDRQTTLSRNILYSIGSLANFFNSKKYDLQLGYEFVNEDGYASALAGTFNNNLSGVGRTLENYDVYASSELAFTPKFSLRPGFRYSFQSKFDDQYAVSLGARYLFERNIELRGTVGKSYRTPNFDELYTYFVDSNHDLQGNESLIPEQSMSYEANIKKATFFPSGFMLNNSLSVTYMNVDDRIANVLVSASPRQIFRYENIDSYRMLNFATSNSFRYNNLDGRLGVSVLGISQKIDAAASGAVSDDKFLYSVQLNANVGYTIKKWNTLISLYYKYTGPFQQFEQTGDTSGNTLFVLSEFEGYSMMDASVIKSFFSKKFDVTLGVRNLFNVSDIRSTTAGAAVGIHAAGAAVQSIGYGRSFFLKLTYNLNFN